MSIQRDQLPQPEPTKDSLADFASIIQGIFDDIFEIISSDVRSFKVTEIDTESEWVDGLSIFRIVLTGQTSTGTSTFIQTGITFNQVITCKLRMQDSSGNFIGTDSQNYASVPLDVIIDSNSNVTINHNDAALQNQTYYLTIEYTR